MIDVRDCALQEALIVIRDDDIYPRISGDNAPPASEFKIEKERESLCRFIGAFVNGKIIGLAIDDGYDGLFHFMVLKGFRQHARLFLDATVSVLKKKLTVEIPKKHRSTINFAKKYGFSIVSEDKNQVTMARG